MIYSQIYNFPEFIDCIYFFGSVYPCLLDSNNTFLKVLGFKTSTLKWFAKILFSFGMKSS